MKTPRPDGLRFIASSLFFICFLYVLASISKLRFDSLLKFGRCALANINMPSAQLYNSSNTLLSSPIITSLALNSSSNDEIRTPVGAKVDVKFVMCNLTKEEQEVLVALEIMRYDDIIILDCEENMNKGKTYTYFSSLAEMFNNTNGVYPPYHYVMKADDDAYFRLQNLVDSLKPLPREDLYYGYVIPCSSMEPFGHYMSGMGYLISWDIVEWIRESHIPKSHLEGPEDKTFGDWIKNGHRAKNRFNAKWSMYNFPEPPTKCTHELWPHTIAVHLLKNQEKWIRTLKYFNVTDNLKPSKLYHIPYIGL
ncbi:PREDICTED: beta-1 3-galactosyltransferase [Prunus dulcis]|uniref:Hexosyltransferase n=1 Tax=Prunus dulcis TaxID=3755 RepID=A0A5E4FLD5_PRUDU|nr:PREDICTED: beta-1 3-galactosyltransferase [Prunus dulcis]